MLRVIEYFTKSCTEAIRNGTLKWRSLKVIDSGTIRKPGYGFLFASHSTL